ncbi:MAG: Smr/MutS family protein [Gammaproteobacteria bacterium]
MNKKTDDDSQLFRQAMHGVKPLSPVDKSVIHRTNAHYNTQYRKQQAQTEMPTLTTSLSIGNAIRADDILAYSQSGLSPTQYRRLQQGQLPIDAELDLHGYTTDQALLALEQLFMHVRETQLRHLRIIHGKGREVARLKNVTAAFLNAQPDILAYHSAPSRLGGTGTVLVLLKR